MLSTDNNDESKSHDSSASGTNDEGFSDSSSVNDAMPVHPVASMRGAFEESIYDSMEDPPNRKVRDTIDAATRRLQLLELEDFSEEYSGRWRQKEGAKFHPLFKIIAQISFGVHLLHKQTAKSDDEVVKILQTHVEEVDGFLQDTIADFDYAIKDIVERQTHLFMPLEHGRTFDKMLLERSFRTAIIEGNDIIERIIYRTTRAMNQSLEDVRKGIDATAELSKYLDRLGSSWTKRDTSLQGLYSAMRGNAEGWHQGFKRLQRKGVRLTKLLLSLETVVNEVSKRAGIASRRSIKHKKSQQSNRRDQPSLPSPAPPSAKSPISHNSSNSPKSIHTNRSSMMKPLPPDPLSCAVAADLVRYGVQPATQAATRQTTSSSAPRQTMSSPYLKQIESQNSLRKNQFRVSDSHKSRLFANTTDSPKTLSRSNSHTSTSRNTSRSPKSHAQPITTPKHPAHSSLGDPYPCSSTKPNSSHTSSRQFTQPAVSSIQPPLSKPHTENTSTLESSVSTDIPSQYAQCSQPQSPSNFYSVPGSPFGSAVVPLIFDAAGLRSSFHAKYHRLDIGTCPIDSPVEAFMDDSPGSESITNAVNDSSLSSTIEPGSLLTPVTSNTSPESHDIDSQILNPLNGPLENPSKTLENRVSHTASESGMILLPEFEPTMSDGLQIVLDPSWGNFAEAYDTQVVAEQAQERSTFLDDATRPNTGISPSIIATPLINQHVETPFPAELLFVAQGASVAALTESQLEKDVPVAKVLAPPGVSSIVTQLRKPSSASLKRHRSWDSGRASMQKSREHSVATMHPMHIKAIKLRRWSSLGSYKPNDETTSIFSQSQNPSPALRQDSIMRLSTAASPMIGRSSSHYSPNAPKFFEPNPGSPQLFFNYEITKGPFDSPSVNSTYTTQGPESSSMIDQGAFAAKSIPSTADSPSAPRMVRNLTGQSMLADESQRWQRPRPALAIDPSPPPLPYMRPVSAGPKSPLRLFPVHEPSSPGHAVPNRASGLYPATSSQFLSVDPHPSTKRSKHGLRKPSMASLKDIFHRKHSTRQEALTFSSGGLGGHVPITSI